MRLRLLTRVLPVCLIALPTSVAGFGGGPYAITEFALEGSRQHSTWRFSGVGADTEARVRTERLGVRWQEALGNRVSGGAELGYLYLRPDERAAGLDPAGYYFGVYLRHHALARGAYSVDLVGAYRYLYADDAHEADSLRLTAHRVEAGIEAAWTVTNALRVGAGSSWVRVEGEERLRGAIERRADLRLVDDFVHRLSAELLTYGPGALGLEYRTGAEEGWRMYARREF